MFQFGQVVLQTGFQVTLDEMVDAGLVTIRVHKLDKPLKLGKAKLTESQIRSIRHLRQQGIPGIELAKKYNVSNSTISAIHKGKIWKS